MVLVMESKTFVAGHSFKPAKRIVTKSAERCLSALQQDCFLLELRRPITRVKYRQ
jgi:hypothetical protein